MKADTQTIDILLLGSGGREHALAAKLAASPRAGKLYIAPGNGGTASCGENVVLDDCDPAAVAAFAQSHGCGLVVIGPEAPLVAGVADAVRAAGIPCFGPGAEGAQMEGSKLFSKQLMERAGIPTAAYGSFTDEASALAYVREQGAPLVVKADGLAAGKGVIVATELEQAEEAVRECFGGTFGDAGSTVVIDHGCGVRSYLYGLQELSVTRGQTVERGQAVGVLGEELTMDFKLGSKSVNPWPLFQTSGGLFWQEKG